MNNTFLYKKDKKMQKKFTLLLVSLILASTLPQMAFGFKNPLKEYNLYAETHNENVKYDNAMSELYYNQNGNQPQNAQAQQDNPPPPQENITTEDGVEIEIEVPKRRNVYLRESSQKVYSKGDGNWINEPYFYDDPNLDSIIEKYRKSNFAGCMQECEAYVQTHPYDTLGFYYLAMSYAKCGKKEDAISAYEKVISINEHPMMVKYATNGRNCVMNDEKEAKCFMDVNEPDYYYPYREMAQSIELTPVDPQELINKNLTALQERLTPPAQPEVQNGEQNGESSQQFHLPFENQDSELDRFINAPYGSGLSSELEKQQKIIQLKKIQQNINNESNDPGKYFQNIRNIKNFDQNKSQMEIPDRIAMADTSDMEALLNSPEYIENKKELDQIKMMFGENITGNSSDDFTKLLPALTKNGEKLSPEFMQTMMMQSLMPDIINFDGKSGF